MVMYSLYKTESESISNQRTLLRRFLQSRKEFEGCEVIEWIDDGYSGTNAERPSFERMIEGLKNGDSQVVICKDFSRFFRDYVEIGDYLERIFPFLGVRFIAVNDGYDSDEYKGSTAGMEVVMKYIVYAYYSHDLSNRIQEAASKTKGSEENLNLTLSRIEKKKKQISLSRVSIYEQYADGKITKEAYLFERDRLNRELEDLTAEQQSTEQELSSLAQSRDDELGQADERAREFIQAEELTNEMLLFFIDRVYVYSGMRTEICYRFGDRIRETLTAETDKPKMPPPIATRAA